MSHVQMIEPRHAQNAKNRRTAFVLLSIAAVFFFGFLARRWLLGA